MRASVSLITTANAIAPPTAVLPWEPALAVVVAVLPSVGPRTAPDVKPVSMTIVEPEPTPDPKLREAGKTFLQDPGEQVVEEADKNAPFESDRNTVAASERPGLGNELLPGQEGMEREHIAFQTRDYTPGELDRPAQPPPMTESMEPAAPSEPVTQPEEARQEQVSAQELLESRPEEDRIELAMAEPRPDREPVLEPRETTPEAEEQVTPQPQVRPTQPTLPGYQPQTSRTKIEGSIDNTGKASVASMATPLGRYKKIIADQIGSLWYYKIENNLNVAFLTAGRVRIAFEVLPEGNVVNIKVLENDSNDGLAMVSQGAIADAPIPPIPEDVVQVLENGRLEVEYTFTIFND